MNYLDLDLSIQLSLFGLTAVVWAGFLTRTVEFVRLERAGVHPRYPESWNSTQRLALERFRLLIGIGLIMLWAAYLFAAPSRRPLEYLGMISMLSVSYAWAVLLATRNWSKLEALPRSFLLVITFLALWWGTAFSAIGWMLTDATARPSIHLIPPGVYAVHEIPHT